MRSSSRDKSSLKIELFSKKALKKIKISRTSPKSRFGSRAFIVPHDAYLNKYAFFPKFVSFFITGNILFRAVAPYVTLFKGMSLNFSKEAFAMTLCPWELNVLKSMMLFSLKNYCLNHSYSKRKTILFVWLCLNLYIGDLLDPILWRSHLSFYCSFYLLAILITYTLLQHCSNKAGGG